MYTSVVVLVGFREDYEWECEECDSIVSRIFYNSSLANNITINFSPVTYDHYLNVLGLDLPDYIFSLLDIESKQVSFN